MATILIVDDHVLNRQFLLALLGFGQHRLLEAADGLQGLLVARAEVPDLIITDIMMPNMDGFQFVMALRDDPALAAIPVIFYTATYSMAQAAVLAEACGVHKVLHKPATPGAIMDAVNVALAGTAARLGSSGRQLATFLHAFDAHSSEIHQFAERGAPAHDNDDLAQVAQRLSQSLADFQSVGLRLTALVDMGLELAGERDPQRLLESGCKIARHLGTARFAVLGIPELDGSAYAHFTARGLEPRELAALALAGPPQGLLGTVLAERRPQRRHALHVNGAAASIGLAGGHPAIDSVLMLPIASPSHTYGWLYLADKHDCACFSDIDEEVLMAVAAQIGVAYENLMLYQRIQVSLAQLENESAARARMTDELRESERRYSDMLANVELLSLMLDGEGRIRYCNDYLLRLTGWQRFDVLGRDWCTLFLPASHHAAQHATHAALLGGAAHARHHQNDILTRAGQHRLVHWNNTVLRSQSGDILARPASVKTLPNRPGCARCSRNARRRCASAKQGCSALS